MNNGGSRKRQFSVTRLSYSRDTRSRIQKSEVSHSPQPVKNQKRETLMCDTCFNHKVTSDKKAQLVKNEEQNGGWNILDTKNPKRVQAHQNQIQKTLQYNLLKMQENQRKRQQEKQLTNDEKNWGSHQQIERIRQLNEQKRIKLRQQLQLQIVTAKERRIRERQQIREHSPFVLIQNKQPAQKHEQIEKYKKTLLEQMNNQKLKKQMENEFQKQSGCGSELSFLKEADQKMQAFFRNQDRNKQNLREQLKRKKQQEGEAKNQISRARKEEENNRLEEERQKRQESQKAEQKRKQMISGYLNDLRKQIQQNQFKKRGEGQKFSQDAGGCLPLADHRTGCNMGTCGCCARGFPRTFLSPYFPQTKP